MSGVSDLPELLCRVDFPLYTVVMLSPRHIIFGGGGGAARTGVQNGFEVFEISHDGDKCTAESVLHHKTGDFAVMNLAAAKFNQRALKALIAVGFNERCHVMSLLLSRERKPSQSYGTTDDVPEEYGTEGGHGTTRRRRRTTSINGSAKKSKGDITPAIVGEGDTNRLVFEVVDLKSVQTDFNMPEPYQKVVRISADGKLLATGGDDGVLRIWTFPDLNAVHELDDHEKEIDDLEFSPDNTKLISISKDRRALVWDVKKGKKHAEMTWDPPNGVKYAYKRVRCGKVDDGKRYSVFTIVNPIGASKPPSYLQRWDNKSFTIKQSVTHSGSLSALAVSDDGNFVATGSMFDGTVEIYIAFSLQKVKRVEKSHDAFITGLEFLPSGEESDPMRGYNDASVVSISVDHKVCIHHIPRLRQISMVFAACLIFGLLFVTFALCSYLGL